MTYDEFVLRALLMGETSESLSFNRPSVKRNSRFMFSLQEDGESVGIKLDWENRDRLLEEQPDYCHLTPHFAKWPGFILKLTDLPSDFGDEVLRLSWEDAPKPAKWRK
jgi:hypothetical protein